MLHKINRNPVEDYFVYTQERSTIRHQRGASLHRAQKTKTIHKTDVTTKRELIYMINHKLYQPNINLHIYIHMKVSTIQKFGTFKPKKKSVK